MASESTDRTVPHIPQNRTAGASSAFAPHTVQVLSGIAVIQAGPGILHRHHPVRVPALCPRLRLGDHDDPLDREAHDAERGPTLPHLGYLDGHHPGFRFRGRGFPTAIGLATADQTQTSTPSGPSPDWGWFGDAPGDEDADRGSEGG